MSIIQTFPFDNPSNYVTNNAEVSGGFGRLALINNPLQIFSQDFTSSSGFTFDSNLTEFVAGVMQQKDQTPSNSLFGVSYSTNANPIISQANLNWHKSGGGLSAVLNGSPIISGLKLVCTGTQGLYYVGNTKVLETHKIKYTPNYTGAPPANINLISGWNGTNNNDRFNLSHSPTGSTLRMTLFDSTGSVVIATATILGAAYSPTAGVEDEIELSLESASPGRVRLFINGTLHATLMPGAWTRGTSSSRFYVGASPSIYDRAEASFDDYIMFDNIQHTATYTPGYTVVPFVFATDTIDLPDFVYTGLGSIVSLDDFTTTEGGEPRYTIEGSFWNGSAWVASDGSYLQANDKATVLANIGALGVSLQTTISVQVVWNDSNAQGSVDLLGIGYTGQKFATEGTIITLFGFVAQTLVNFDATEVVPALTAIHYILEINGSDIWHNGVDWVSSNGTVSEANTLQQVKDNLPGSVTDNVTVKIKVVLTGDGTVTSEIDSITVEFNFGALEPTLPIQSNVFGFLKNAENVPIEGATVTVRPFRDQTEYVEAASRIIATPISRVTDDEGFFSFNLIASSQYESVDSPSFKYLLSIKLPNDTSILDNNQSEIVFEVPDSPSVNITDKITAV